MGSLPTDKIISCFYDSSEDCIKVVNTDGVLMSFNPNGLKVMEIDSPKDVIGKDWLTFWQGHMYEKAAQALKQAVDGKLATFEGYCPTFKGTMKYWQVAIAPLYDDFGGIQWLLVTSRDLTKQKNLEKKVLDQEKEIRKLQSLLAKQHATETIPSL
jgi:PAS domain S-box-containing protein